MKPLLLCLLLFVNAGAIPKSTLRSFPFKPAQKRDRVIATKTITGTLKGFEVGDYVHAVIKLPNDKENSYYIGGQGADYFMALHKDEQLVITYQIVDSYIPEAGGKTRIERIKSVRAGKLTSDAWWKKLRAKNSFDQLDKRYGPLVEKLRLNP